MYLARTHLFPVINALTSIFAVLRGVLMTKAKHRKGELFPKCFLKAKEPERLLYLPLQLPVKF